MRSPPESWLIGRIRLPAGIAWKLWSAGPDGADGAVVRAGAWGVARYCGEGVVA